MAVLKGPISCNIWLSSQDRLEIHGVQNHFFSCLGHLHSFPCHSYRTIQNKQFTRECCILEGHLVTNTGNRTIIFRCRRSLQSFHLGLPTLVLDTFSSKVLRTVHVPLQSLWAELFFLAAQVTVPTTLQDLPYYPAVTTLNSPVSLLFHIILLTSLRWGSKSRAFPSDPAEHPFKRNFVCKHAFTTGSQKPLKKPFSKRRKESFYHVTRGTCLEHFSPTLYTEFGYIMYLCIPTHRIDHESSFHLEWYCNPLHH